VYRFSEPRAPVCPLLFSLSCCPDEVHEPFHLRVRTSQAPDPTFLLCSSVCSVFSCGFVHLADEELALSKWSQEIRTADDASEALFFSRLYVILICYLLPIFPWDGMCR
jgi:hypothetical protein